MNIRNKFLSYALVGLVATSSVSCKKYLDINTSPVAATSVEPKLLFGYSVVAWNSSKESGDFYFPIALFTQTIASGGDFGWGKDNLYSLSPNFLGNVWKVYYNTAGNNLQLAIKNATAATPVNNNAAAQSRIVMAQLMYEATMLYGDVPFSEAWNSKIQFPKYDAQKDVLEGILKWLDESIAQLDPASPLKIADYDIYYGGNIGNWKKLATSLKLKVLMAMVDKDPTKAAAIGQLVSNPSTMIASASENWVHKYKTTTNNENPKYRLFKTYTGGQNQWFFANKNVFDFMQPLNDPRIPKYFDKGPSATTYKAVGTEEEADVTTSLISSYLYRSDAPSLQLSYQEILFFQAEAYARGLGVTKDLVKANDLFKKGVEEAVKFYGADPTAFIPTLPNLTTAADPVKEIHIQQWVDLMDRPFDAFVQWRRSGSEGNEVPTLTLPPNATAGPLIRRYTYSPDEIAANPNIPNPQPKYYEKMWFDL